MCNACAQIAEKVTKLEKRVLYASENVKEPEFASLSAQTGSEIQNELQKEIKALKKQLAWTSVFYTQ